MCVLKPLGAIEHRHEHQRGERSDAVNGLKPHGLRILFCSRGKLLVQLLDALI